MSTAKLQPSDDVLSAAELETISRHAVTRTFPKNRIVVNEGDRADSLYIVLSGKVKVFVAAIPNSVRLRADRVIE